MYVFMQSVRSQGTSAPCLIGVNGFHVMVAFPKFDFGYQASYINNLESTPKELVD
jgi:hypothetical protein